MEKEQSYFDRFGNEISEGDLLKVYHFRSAHRRRLHFIYQIVTLEEFGGKLYYRAKEYHVSENKGHYNLRAVADKETRVIESCQVIDCKDASKTPRQSTQINPTRL